MALMRSSASENLSPWDKTSLGASWSPVAGSTVMRREY
eukprot:CAMPEP_0194057082 /NCGR_PEP_ID=MMETSP0009_2-20130614/62301_1 /TAXON_ID=210454 /ORGANISM="Grammatophora oceanica, Strain CCMP 410" /LENGTH=37 /DNA_ID= /DNA_START= /DNA_END= /DNA_ORIENTATION=